MFEDYAMVVAPVVNAEEEAEPVFHSGQDYLLVADLDKLEAYGPYTATLEGEEVVMRWNKPGLDSDGSIAYYIHRSGVYDKTGELTYLTAVMFMTEEDCEAMFDQFVESGRWSESE